ncbi:MAG: metallophosphoesterase family protein [Pseudomonadota bacterium]
MAPHEHILAVGDLHARYDLLERLLGELLPKLPADVRLVFLGDYIDRGPDAARVVARLIALAAERPGTVFLMGNHERMLLDALEGLRVPIFLHNGGLETLASYGLGPDDLGRVPAAHLDFLRGLGLFYETDAYVFVHAGLRPGLPLDRQHERDLLWIRDEFYNQDHGLGKTVVFGHTPFGQPLVRPGLIGIDTGAVYGNHLTCLLLPETEFFSLS